MKLFTEIVHDVIGGDQVLDQFDLGYPSSFYGSTQDAYVTGTLLTIDQSQSTRTNQLVFTAGNRGKLFNKLDANIQLSLDSTYGSYEVTKNPSYAERLIPWTVKTSNAYRVIQAIDDKERIYDSCPPNIQDCFSADGVTFWKTHDDAEYWLSPYGNVKTSNIGYMLFNARPLTNNKNLSNDKWTWSFPFEDGYKNARRVINTQDVLPELNFTTSTNWYPQSYTSVKENKYSPVTVKSFLPLLPGLQQDGTVDVSFRADITLPNNAVGSYRVLVPSDIDLGTINSNSSQLMTGTMSNNDMVKFLYGFGDLNNITYTKYSLNEEEDEELLSSSYFTGFELQNWTSLGGLGTITHYSSSFNGSPIPVSGGVSHFNAQFNQNNGPVIVKWLAASGNIGLSDGYPAEKYLFVDTGSEVSVAHAIANMGQTNTNSMRETGWTEYPWVLVAKEGTTTVPTFDENSDSLEMYNYVSSSVYNYYPDSGRGATLSSTTAVNWRTSTSPPRNWVLASFLSASAQYSIAAIPDYTFSNQYRMPNPTVRGSKTISSQRVDITSSLPWKLAYQRAISAPACDYFYSSFTGMPSFPSSLGNVDQLIDKLQGTDTVFAGTQLIEQTPQVLSDFTSSLFPAGAYQLKFSFVKTGLSGTTNGVDRAFIDNVNIFTYGVGQLTGNFDPSNRIGYGHYPEFRKITRDTRTSPYFPGTGIAFKSKDKIYKNLTKLPNLSKLTTSLSVTPILPSVDVSTVSVKNPIDLPNIVSNASFKIEAASTSSVLTSLIKIKNITEFLKDTLAYLSSNSYGGYEFGISPVIRGWKYGLYSGFPVYTHAVFRRNKFGQFRDMLEQRLFTKFIYTDDSAIDNVVRGTKTKRTKNLLSARETLTTKLQDGPVTVKFVSQEAKVDSNGMGIIVTNQIDPSLTQAQNLDFEAKSSMPFFDGESKNRKISQLFGREMIVVTSASPEFVSTAPAITRVLPINNLTITTRGTPTRS